MYRRNIGILFFLFLPLISPLFFFTVLGGAVAQFRELFGYAFIGLFGGGAVIYAVCLGRWLHDMCADEARRNARADEARRLAWKAWKEQDRLGERIHWGRTMLCIILGVSVAVLIIAGGYCP